MDRSKGWVGLVFALACVAWNLPAAHAQTATILGVVSDKEGNPLPGVTVELYSNSGRYKRETYADDRGSYAFRLVPPGFYGLRAHLAGFSDTVLEFYELSGGKEYSFPITMSLQSVTQEITVVAEAPMLRIRGNHRSKVKASPGPEPRFPSHGSPESDSHDGIVENGFELATKQPVSTFSIDVDTASYSNLRRMIQDGQMPRPESVRIEEMLNSFSYTDAPPTDGTPFSVRTETASAPWNAKHRLVRVSLRGRDVPQAERPASNLVFLIDVSGSMAEENKLPLVKQSLRMLTEKLRAKDHVAVVVVFCLSIGKPASDDWT